MYQRRQKVTTKIPIQRKGTKYIARASSHLENSVPLVIAVRDMLKLAKNKKEVKKMINSNSLKINGRIVKDQRESIKLFNILQADKTYTLTLSKTHRFTFIPSKSSDRLCKVTNKKLLSAKKIQLNLHDGSNILTKDKINVNDSIYLSPENKITKHISLEKGKTVFIMSGKYSGLSGKISSIENKKAEIKLENKEEPVKLDVKQLIVQ